MAEKEYIEREVAIDNLTERNLVVHMDSVNDGLVASCHRSAQRIIANIPAADVRPVVLCRDCIHARHYTSKIKCGYWSEQTASEIVCEDDFCSHGKKREERQDA